MKALLPLAVGLFVRPGCPSTSAPATPVSDAAAPAPKPDKVNWQEIDRGVARTKEREKKKADGTQTSYEDGKKIQEETLLEQTTESGKKITIKASSTTDEK